MPWQDLPLTGDPYRNVDPSELDQISPLVQDGYVDELGYTQKRPGMRELFDLDTNAPIDGLYWWEQQNMALVVSNGRTWKITDSTGNRTELTSDVLTAGTPVTFAVNGQIMTMANGARMVTTTTTGPTTYMADANAPTVVTHVAFLDGYTMANVANTQQFMWSENLTPLVWNLSNEAFAQGSPDNIMALKVGWRELILAGTDSMEVWYNDGVSPFVRLNGGFVERGIGAIYSLQQVGTSWFWLDEKRRFVQLDNRTPTILSFPFNKEIQAMSAVADGVSSVMEVDGLPLYVITFPAARRTFAYNYTKQAWQDWGSWNTATGVYDAFKGRAYCFARAWNLHLVGDPNSGKVYQMSRSLFTDDSQPIRTVRRTGFVSHGTMQHKFSREVRIRVKRGAGNAVVSDPQMWVRWRNDGGAWGNEHWISLGAVGQHEYVGRLFRTGVYRTRQWEFGHTDDSDFILVGAQEHVEMSTR